MDNYGKRPDIEIRIDWGELDYYGHVNNVFFFKYAQTARVNYWDCMGLTQSHLQTNEGPLLASCKCNFKKILRYPGTIRVITRCTAIGNSSFTFIHQILDEQGEPAAEVEDVMVMFDYNTRTKMRVPDWMRERIAQLEKA